MTSPIAIRYQLDLTGINPDNLVRNEPHSLLINPIRAVVPNYGPYYTTGLIVKDAAAPTVALVPHVQYTCCELVADATNETGKQVMSVILITDPAVSSNVLITYQVLGGEYAYSTDALLNMLAALQLDNRSVAWGAIIGTPDAFPPTPHLHDIGDTYGWEYVVDALESLRQAILVGNQAAFDNMMAYIIAALEGSGGDVGALTDAFNAHVNDHNNPHQTTKAHVGLGNVQNFGLASQADVALGTSNSLYLTPYSVAAALAAAGAGAGGTLLAANNLSDLVNKPQSRTNLGLGSVQNFGIATQADAVAGTVDNLYMTPLKVSQAITALALSPLNTSINTVAINLSSHTGNSNNPHSTTKAQVGLANVDNTSDANKPISNATQTALNLKVDTTTLTSDLALKATLGAGVSFFQVAIGLNGVLLYESNTVPGQFDFRVGTTGNYAFGWISPTCDLHLQGSVVATNGYQVSDERLKDNVTDRPARALWRNLNYKSFRWIQSGKDDQGFIAQLVEQHYPEYVIPYTPPDEKVTYKAIDKTSMAMEMATAAGTLLDAQAARIAELEDRLASLEALVASLSKED